MADANNLSNKTLAGVPAEKSRITVGTPLSEEERLATGEFSKDVSVTKDNPNTVIDMYNLETWKIGDDEPVGTFARTNAAQKRLRDDMRRGKSDAQNYKHLYVDTLTTKKTVSQQLEELK